MTTEDKVREVMRLAYDQFMRAGDLGETFAEWRAGSAAALESAVMALLPEGWVLVPKEPDDEMLIAGQEAWMRTNANRPAIEDCEQSKVVYHAMLAAAPPAEQKDMPT